MSRKKSRPVAVPQSNVKQSKNKKSDLTFANFMIVGLLVLCVGIGVFAQSGTDGALRVWLGSFTSTINIGSTTAVTDPSPLPPELAANKPTRELVYAGGKLVAVTDGKWQKFNLAVWRLSTAVWFVMDSTGGTVSAQWGQGGAPESADIPTPGDYDGDEKTDFAVWRPSNGNWYVVQSGTGTFLGFDFGLSGDKPVPADYDGDNRTDMAVFRPSNNTWYVSYSSTGTTVSQYFGASSDLLVPSDYDGDNKADYAVWRPSDGTWYYLRSSLPGSPYTGFQWGTSADKPVPGDYNGDNKTDFAVWQPNGTWAINHHNGSIRYSGLGLQASDIAVPGDYDADGKTDVAVWRPSTGVWYIEQSGTSPAYQQYTAQFGMSGDIPVPAPYHR